MGPGLSLARPESRVFWKARSPTFEEGPKTEQARSPTFGEGLENLSFLTAAIHSKISRPGIHGRAQSRARPEPDFKARARPGTVLLGPDPSLPTTYVQKYFEYLLCCDDEVVEDIEVVHVQLQAILHPESELHPVPV